MAGLWKTVNRKLNRWHIYIYAIIFSLTILCILYTFRSVHVITARLKTLQNSYVAHESSERISVVIILCNDSRRKSSSAAHNETFLHSGNHRERRDARIARDFDRQINQTVVLLKSIAIQQSLSNDQNQVDVLILSDQHENFRRLQQQVFLKERWCEEYLKRLRLTFVPVSNPPGQCSN